MKVIFGLKQGNVATFGCNVATFQRGKQPTVDPTRSTGRRDSLLNGRKMWVDFRVLENPSSRITVFLWSRHLLFVVIL